MKIKELLKICKQSVDDLYISPGVVGGQKRYKIDVVKKIKITIDPAYFGGVEEFYYVVAYAIINYFFEECPQEERNYTINRLVRSKQFRAFVKKKIGIPIYVAKYSKFLKLLRDREVDDENR